MARDWFDAHLDLAYLAACGRDMTRAPADAGGPDLPAAVTFRSLSEGGVRAALATIFIEPGEGHANVRYTPGNAESAHRAGLLQLDLYHAWEHQGLVELGFEHAETPAGDATPHNEVSKPIQVGLLIEGADCIRGPDELAWWVERGVVAIGLSWARGSRFAAGNAVDPSHDSGLTDLGRALVQRMDETRVGSRNVVHDASHLSDRSLTQLLELTDQPVIASHSNCRALVASQRLEADAIPAELRSHPDPSTIIVQRHLTDEAIIEISRRGGIVGLNLYSPFISPGARRDRRATIDEWCRHADHVVNLLGHHHSIALGSDMDGGFSAERLPEGVNHPRDLELLAQALLSRGWPEAGVASLAWGNWARFWGLEQNQP